MKRHVSIKGPYYLFTESVHQVVDGDRTGKIKRRVAEDAEETQRGGAATKTTVEMPRSSQRAQRAFRKSFSL